MPADETMARPPLPTVVPLATPPGATISTPPLDTADAAPTTQEIAMFAELEKALEEQLSAWGQLKSIDIPELNDELKKAGLPPIDLQKPVPGKVDAAETTSQDRDRNEE